MQSKKEDNEDDLLKIRKNADGSWECPFFDHKNLLGADWCEK